MNTEALSNIVGAQNYLTDEDSKKTYGKDWTKHFTPNPCGVVFPTSTEQVAEIVKWARENKVALVPSGGRTGLSAAAYATNGELVVSMEKMNKILDLNAIDRVITCQSGVVTENAQNHAKENGFYFPVDFAARGSSQIGGNVATNAGGIKVIKYGMTRNWVTGLKVVTGKGEILNLNNSLVKNATGYDLRQLFIGSEGTLGFITEVSFGLTRQPEDLEVLLMGVPDLKSVMEIYKLFRGKLELSAFEMFTDLATKYVTEMGRVNKPFTSEPPYYVLIEIETTNGAMDIAMELFEQALEDGIVIDGTVSQNEKQARDFWSLREDITEATSHKLPYKNDISVRVSKVPEFLERMDGILEKDYPGVEVVWFGHIGDGNLHVNILKPDDMSSEDFMEKCHQVDKQMFAMIQDLGGSVSAEHGVGLVKKGHLDKTKSLAEIEYMRGIKRVFDPDGIMNPGKVFDL